MIIKPEGYDQVQAITGETSYISGGGFVCKILGSSEFKNAMDQQILTLRLDIAEGPYKGFFAHAYNDGKKKKWGCYYKQIINAENAALIKGLLDCIEGGNKIKWPLSVDKIDNKLCGFIFRRYELIGIGSEGLSFIKPIQPRPIEIIRHGLYEIPPDRRISRYDTNDGGANSFEYF